MNQRRIVVCNEGAYFRNGLFVLDGALTPAKDHLTVLSPKGEAGRSIGLASHMQRELNGDISFCITLEEYLNHDNFDFQVYLTSLEYDDDHFAAIPTPFYRVVQEATITAVLARHIRYTPKETPDE